MAVSADSKNNISVSISDGDSSKSSVEGYSMIRPTFQNKKSLSSRRLTRNGSLTSNDASKPLRPSNSTQRLSQFKKRISSLGYKRSDSYQKIDSNADSFNHSWNNDEPKHLDSISKSNTPPSRPGMRRRRSCDDDFHSLYKAAAMVIETQRLDMNPDLMGNPLPADEFPVREPKDLSTKSHAFVPNTLSSPNLRFKSPGASSSSSSSKSSEKSPSDLLTRAAAVAGRKQRGARRPPSSSSSSSSPASSIDLSTPTAVPLGQKLSVSGFSSSPHLLSKTHPPREEPHRRQSDPAMDLATFSNKFLNNAITSTPRNRRRSKRLIPIETVMQHSNDEKNDGKRRRDMFRNDFPEEPIPSDSILLRLYGNVNLPPPPPPPPQYPNASDEQASASNGSYGSVGTPTTNRARKRMLRAPILSPKDLPKKADDMTEMSFTSELEWKAWKDSEDKSRRKRNPNDESRRSESSKSKGSVASRRRSSSKSRHGDAGDRSYSHSHSLSGHRSRSHKGRHSSKSKSDTSGKGIRRRDGLPHSSHHGRDSSHGKDYASPKSKSRKSAETMKIRSKNGLKKSPSDGTSSPAYGSGYDAFQALLDLSNGSFFDSNDDLSEYKTSESLAFLRTSLTRMNSAPKMNSTSSFNDSANSFGSFGSFAEGDEKADKERKKKRKGKRASAEGKTRSRSADENRNTSSKSRRGKRTSKTKSSKVDPKSNDDSKNSLSASWYDESDSLLFDSSLRGQQWTSNSERGPERLGMQHQSPRMVTRKNSCNESSSKQRKNSKSPKFLNKKELNSGSPGSLSTRKKHRRASSSKTNTQSSQHLGGVDPSLEQGSTNSRRIHQDTAFEQVPKHAKEEKKVEDDGCCEFPLSSWGDEPAKTNRITAEEIIATARDILSSPKALMGNDQVQKTRWNPQPSPMLNAMSPRSDCDSAGATVPRFDTMPIPTVDEPAPPPTTPPRSPKKLDFRLNFMEYQDISPLTIASKKVEPDSKLMTALNYLEG